MQKITTEEREKFVRERPSKIPLIKEIMALDIGEHLLLRTEEWHLKTKPGGFIRCYAVKQKKLFSVKKVDGGWIITRKQ